MRSIIPRKRWPVVALLLGVLALLVALAAPRGSDTEGFAGLLALLSGIAVGLVALRWLWLKLTYRVGTRLLLSYLLIGLLPFLLFAALTALVGYLLIGQYASRHLSLALDRTASELSFVAREAAERAAAGDPRGGRGALEKAVAEGPPGARWLLDLPGATGEGPAGIPAWLPAGAWQGTAIAEGRAWLAVTFRAGETAAAVLTPLDRQVAEWLLAGRFVAARFAAAPYNQPGSSVTVNLGAERGRRTQVTVDGRELGGDQIEAEWLQARATGGTLAERIGVTWVRLFEDVVLWEDGRAAESWFVMAIVKTSVRAALDDFLLASKSVGQKTGTVMIAVGAVFGFFYLLAVSFAVVMIVSIARSTSRLTRGAREVSSGRLDHRIKVRRRDQLGDLAVSFNSMTGSVQTMLVEVREKERLARELELAREIQESLLPARQFRHGGLEVHAHFRPAAEVGGDYFDLFPLERGRLVLAAGDVAGHGLSTGLLMAMVKSAVAALMHEGHRGIALLERLNALLLEQPHRHRMVTLALLEIDELAGSVEVTNSGHPPVLIICPDGSVEEVMLGALPLGHRWRRPPAALRVAFPPGSRLVVFSDGLVEALSSEGEPFGYERLRIAVERFRDAAPAALLAAVLGEMEAFTGGAPLADDLTVLVVASAPAGGGQN